MSTSKLSVLSPVTDLYKGPSKTASKLVEAGISTIEDLLWVLPRKVIRLPDVQPFKFANLGDYFRGVGTVVSIQSRPNFKARGKGKTMLFNLSVIVQDNHSDQLLTLRWFNCYSSIQQKIESLSNIEFLGVVSEFNEQLQITNPDISAPGSISSSTGLKIQYPTINSVSTTHLKNTIDKVPDYIWNNIEENLPQEIIGTNSFIQRSQAFKYLHGKVEISTWTKDNFSKAKERLIYEEFFLDQIKLSLRKKYRSKLPGIKVDLNDSQIKQAVNLYPYTLTKDQNSSLQDVILDLQSSSPMMRLIQGDVGCGKTTIAVIACYLLAKNNYQSAIMCPTEALASQHLLSIKEVLPSDIRIAILLGSTPTKEKQIILSRLKKGEIDIIIGTHSLFQDSVEFKKLGLSVIDEQHKFGVNQRLKLTGKSPGSHCLIMSATPIPRSLSLTQYGDLEISTIKTMPSGRKGTQTKIVTPDTFSKFLSFLKTRISMGEQAYIIVPAITESPNQDIIDLEKTVQRFNDFFPKLRISPLHGQMKSEEKSQTFIDFAEHKIDILIATSVIEVGINVINSTVMGILNPERFGLSSLHQMRGRVGRGHKPGFCFLVIDRELAPESMHRLRVIENNSDGFKIAEEDLKIRGEGDLFGSEQSGIVTQKRIADILLHQEILYKAINDFNSVKKTSPKELNAFYNHLEKDEKIFSTI